jgi:hypothetical protein
MLLQILLISGFWTFFNGFHVCLSGPPHSFYISFYQEGIVFFVEWFQIFYTRFSCKHFHYSLYTWQYIVCDLYFLLLFFYRVINKDWSCWQQWQHDKNFSEVGSITFSVVNFDGQIQTSKWSVIFVSIFVYAALHEIGATLQKM